MSEFRRSARDLLSVLDATDAYLGMVAATRLYYSSVVRVEVEAVRTCEELLAEIGVEEGLDVVVLEEGTDELLAAAVDGMGPELDEGPESFVEEIGDPVSGAGLDQVAASDLDAIETDDVVPSEVLVAMADVEEPEAEASDEPEAADEPEAGDEAGSADDDADADEAEASLDDLVLEAPAESEGEDVVVMVEELEELEELGIEDEITGEVDRSSLPVSPLVEDTFPDPDDDMDETLVMPIDALDEVSDSEDNEVLIAAPHADSDSTGSEIETFDLLPDIDEEDISSDEQEITSIRGLD